MEMVKMDQNDFAEFRQHSKVEYAKSMSIESGKPAESFLEKADEEISKRLPNGADTADQFLYWGNSCWNGWKNKGLRVEP